MRVVGLLGVAISACVEPFEPGVEQHAGQATEHLPGSDTGSPDGRPVSDSLFDFTRVHEIRVELTPGAEAALATAPLEYAPGAVVLAGERFENVGVRLKGNNSFRPLSGKPSLKIRLDAYVDGQSFDDMRRVTLNNMIEDPSSARELLTYWLWNDAGMIAPRAAYAQVYVNDTYYGLYLLLESMDSTFLEKRFTNPDGDLWEGQNGADFTAAGVPFFDLKTGDGDQSHLATVAAALATPTGDYYAAADAHLQMDQVIDYWAWTMATANLDAYPFTLNDYTVYADPSAGNRLTISPWGMDESWNENFVFQWGQGVAMVGCAADAACFARVLARTEAALQHSEGADVPGQLEAFYALSESAVASDPRTPWTSAQREEARTDLLSFTESWPDELRDQLAAAQP